MKSRREVLLKLASFIGRHGSHPCRNVSILENINPEFWSADDAHPSAAPTTGNQVNPAPAGTLACHLDKLKLNSSTPAAAAATASQTAFSIRHASAVARASARRSSVQFPRE
jgi:hypothetical protein